MGYFAGETNLLYYNKNPFVISDVINSELKLVTDQFRANKLALNESKPKLLLVGPINKLNLTPYNIKLNEHSLTPFKLCHLPFALRLNKLYLRITKLKIFEKFRQNQQ